MSKEMKWRPKSLPVVRNAAWKTLFDQFGEGNWQIHLGACWVCRHVEHRKLYLYLMDDLTAHKNRLYCEEHAPNG